MEPQKFGAFIQERRRALGLKQSDLAEILNVTDKAVSRWERGVGFPDIKLLEPLANALDLTLVELMQSRIIQQPLPKEEADALLSETVELIEVQKKISWQRRLILFIGYTVLVLAGLFLFWVSRNTQWEPQWLGKVVYAIAFLGLFFGSRALQYIVKQLYLQKKPFGIWHSRHTWVWAGLAFLGAQILARAFGHSTAGYVISLLSGGCLIIAALIYYAYHEQEINE